MILIFAMRCVQMPADSKRPVVVAIQLLHMYCIVKKALK